MVNKRLTPAGRLIADVEGDWSILKQKEPLMCEDNNKKNCTQKSCKNLGTLACVNKTGTGQKGGFGRWAYHSGFITQLMAQKNELISQARRNRKNPDFAIDLYRQNQNIISDAKIYPLAKTT